MTVLASAGPVQCAPWCAYQDDPDYFGGEVGNCLGVELRIPLTIEQSGDPGDHAHEGHDYLTVYPVRRPDQPDAVFIAHGILPGMDLTPADTEQLIEALQLVLGQMQVA